MDFWKFINKINGTGVNLFSFLIVPIWIDYIRSLTISRNSFNFSLIHPFLINNKLFNPYSFSLPISYSILSRSCLIDYIAFISFSVYFHFSSSYCYSAPYLIVICNILTEYRLIKTLINPYQMTESKRWFYPSEIFGEIWNITFHRK